jgi:N-terminal domain of CBF1 interacting co-repressor CIR
VLSHLLGKKSWNVYNQDNIDRVRRDEAEAQDREDEQERRNQIVDSERRLRLLRGVQVDQLPVEDDSPLDRSRESDHGHSRKRRRLAGEDDTDRDMRIAKEEAALQARPLDVRQTTNEPLTDARGHIDLFSSMSQVKEKNIEAEAERARKKRDHEDQYTMRFSNAAGFKQGLNAPWYSSNGQNDAEVLGKDLWGNEDIGRKEREKRRIVANDPLAAMKRGVKQLRDVEKSRKDWTTEREREMRDLKELEQARRSSTRHRKRRQRKDDSDSLEDLRLDNSSKGRRDDGKDSRAYGHRHGDDSQGRRQHVPSQGAHGHSKIT